MRSLINQPLAGWAVTRSLIKQFILVPAAVLAVLGLVTGCDLKSSSSSSSPDSQLTAYELAGLMDFHAFKGSIPPAQKPVKEIRLVLIKDDVTNLTTVRVSGTCAFNVDGRVLCTSLLLGFRIEQGAFVGHLDTRDASGGGVGWNLNFKVPSDDEWAVLNGPLCWNRDSAELASGYYITNENNGSEELPSNNKVAIELIR